MNMFESTQSDNDDMILQKVEKLQPSEKLKERLTRLVFNLFLSNSLHYDILVYRLNCLIGKL